MATKTQAKKGKRSASRAKPPTLEQLDEHRTIDAAEVKPLTRPQLMTLLADSGAIAAAAAAPQTVMSLAARRPHGQKGFIDGYRVGRWDCESNQIFLDPIVNSGGGVWTGSALYGNFKAPAAATYLVVVHFYGANIAMNLNGPWGTKTAYSQNNTPAAVSAPWIGNQGESMGYTIGCTGLYLGFVTKIEILRLP